MLLMSAIMSFTSNVRKKQAGMPDPQLMFPVPVDSRAAAIWQGMVEQSQLQGVDWEVISFTAEANNALPAFYDAIRRNKYTSYIPPAILNHMEKVYRLTQGVNVVLLENLRRILSLLNANQIPIIVLKGAALAELVYSDIGLRPMSDLDLLLRIEHTERAVTCLLAAGYQFACKPELLTDFDRQFPVTIGLISPEPIPCVVEIHRRSIGPLFAYRYVDHEAIWERATKSTIEGQSAYILGAEDWVLHQAAYAFYMHRRINWLTLIDLDHLIRFLDGHLNWETLVKIGTDFHWLPALAAALPPLVTFCNSPVPKWVIQTASAYQLSTMERRLLSRWLKPGRTKRHHGFQK
jgi:hypothetical protein